MEALTDLAYISKMCQEMMSAVGFFFHSFFDYNSSLSEHLTQ